MDVVILSVLTLTCYTCSSSSDTACVNETECQPAETYCKTVENGAYSCVVCFNLDYYLVFLIPAFQSIEKPKWNTFQCESLGSVISSGYFCFSDGVITSRTCAETCEDSASTSCCSDDLCWGRGRCSASLFKLCSIRTPRRNLYDLFSLDSH